MTPTQTASQPLKLMAVLAHPDDESLGIGGTLAKYAGEGVETYLVTATRGERGRFGQSGEKPPPDVVGRVREAELREAAAVLGVREVNFLDYYDGDLDQVNVPEAVARIAGHVCRVKPHVVITFGSEGAALFPGSATWATAISTSAICSIPEQPHERELAEKLNHQLVMRALSMEGTCTGEHGVGLHKMEFLVTETGAGAVDMMRTIKRALGPRNIMNPGKIFSL